MPLESATYISDLDPSNPVGSSDLVSSLDDHMRLVKATLQTTFPGIEGAVTATHTELSFLDGVTGTTGTGKLVLDDAPTIADLTVTDSITLPAGSVADAALSSNVPLLNASNTFSAQAVITGSHSTDTRIRRADTTGALILLGGTSTTRASGARIALYGTDHSAQPGDLAIFAGTGGTLTVSAGSTGTVALDGATMTLNGVNVTDYARLSQANTFTAPLTISAATPFWRVEETDQGEDGKNWLGISSGGTLFIGPYTDGLAAGTGGLTMARNGATVTGAVLEAEAIQLDGETRVATIANSTSTTLTPGRIHHVTGNCTVPTLAAGQWVAIVNHSSSPITLTRRSGTALYWTLTGEDSATVTIGPRGRVVVSCAASGSDYVSGDIVGST